MKDSSTPPKRKAPMKNAVADHFDPNLQLKVQLDAIH
jgi:hypothetical protein